MRNIKQVKTSLNQECVIFERFKEKNSRNDIRLQALALR
jgi:hypothetical protein